MRTSALPDQSWPKPKTPSEFLRWYLRQVETGEGRSCAEALADFEEQKSNEHERFVSLGRTSVDQARFEVRLQRLETAIRMLLDAAEEAIRRHLQQGVIIALGSYLPHEADMVIPPKQWPFLSLDFGSAVATSGRIAFRNVRFSLFSDFSEAQKGQIKDLIRWSTLKLRQIETGSDPADSWPRSPHPRAGTHEGKQADQSADNKTKIYTRVAQAWAALPEKDKARVERRGGKKYVTKLIHDQMPEIKFASVERELRRVIQDEGKNGKKAGK